jgi:hypothetical protein
MSEVLKIRDSDGRVVGHFPDMATATDWAETGHTLRELGDGEAYDPSMACTDVAGALVPDIEPLRADRKAALATYRDDVVLATVTTDFGTFYADDKTKLLMAGKLLGLLLMERLSIALPATARFKTTAGFQTFDTSDFMIAALQVLGGIESAFATQDTLESEIEAALTLEELEAVTWPE